MPIDTTRTVHVKDLHHDVQEQELFTYFSSVGQVSSVKLHRDRQTRQSLGFAFITYYNPAHAAAAVAQLHYTTLRGHPIVVMWVGEHEALDPEANLFVRNLDHSISNEQLYELFANYGRVVSAKVMTDPATQISKGYGYVQFQFATDAQVAMQQLQGYTFGQYQLQIDVFRPKGARYSANSSNMSTSATAAMYYDPNGNSSSYNAAYEETYDEMYYHGGGFSQAGYGDEYASYYYGDNNANNTNYTNTNNSVQDTSNTEPAKVHTVSIRVIDDGKGTLSDLSPSAKEWSPPTNTTATATLSSATVASLSSNLKPDSPVFIPGGVSNTNANKVTNTKKKLPMNAVVPNKDATLSVNTSNTANSNNSKLSPNAPVWTSASANPPSTNNSNSLSTNTNSTSPNIAPLLPTPITAHVTSSSTVSTTNNSTNFNSFPTTNFPPEASKSVKDSFSSSPLLTSLSLPPSTTTVSTGSSVPPLMTTSTSAGTPHSAISNTSTLSSSGINSLSFLDNGVNSISNNIFTPANSLLSFPLSSVTTSATTSTASSYNSASAVTTSYNNGNDNNALRLPISPSSPTTFPFSVTGASYANLTSPSRNTSLTNNDNTHVNGNDPMNDDLPPMVSSSPFPFHFALSSTSTSTKSISSPDTLLHKHHHHSNLPSDIHLIHSHSTSGSLRTHTGIFPLTPSSPFPLSSLVSHDTAVGVTSEEHREGKTCLPFASDCSVSSLQQQLQHLLLNQHRAVSQFHDTQPRDTIDPLQQLFFTVTFLQSLSSPVSSSSVSSSLFGDTLLLDDHFSTLNALPSTSFLSQQNPIEKEESETARVDPVKNNAAVKKLLDALTPEAVPLLDNMRTHLQTLMDMCDTRRTELLRDTAAVASTGDNDDNKTQLLATTTTEL